MGSVVKNRILCVDDSEDNCFLVNFVLTEAGYEVESAQSFTEALNLIENGGFQLCLVDIFLPDGSGIKLVEKIHGINPSMPIIVWSGDESTQKQAMQAGAQNFILKPIEVDLLAQSINQLLQLD